MNTFSLRGLCHIYTIEPLSVIRNDFPSEIKVTGLTKLPFDRLPEPFVVVSVDGEPKFTTRKSRKTCDPCWKNDIDM